MKQHYHSTDFRCRFDSSGLDTVVLILAVRSKALKMLQW